MDKKFIAGDKVYLRREILDSDWPEQYSKAGTDTMSILEEFIVKKSNIDSQNDNAQFILIRVESHGEWWYPSNCFELVNESNLLIEKIKNTLTTEGNGILISNKGEKLKLIKLINFFKIPNSYKGLIKPGVIIENVNINYDIGYFSRHTESSGSFSFRNNKEKINNIITFQELIQPLIDYNDKLKKQIK